MAHRGKEKARKLAKALAMKYLVELDPKKPHKYNVHELLGDELYALTRQALAFRAARLPPRYLCRLNAFIANVCAAVPEPPLPGVFSRLRDRYYRRDSAGGAGSCSGGELGGGSEMDSEGINNAHQLDGNSAGTAESGRRFKDKGDELELPQIGEDDLRARLECYICALWAAANYATAVGIAKESFRGKPKEAKAAEQAASRDLDDANRTADAMRVTAAINAFADACHAQATFAPNLTLLQNVQPRLRLEPVVDSLCCEVLGVPGMDSTGRAQIQRLVESYEKQHSFFQSAEVRVYLDRRMQHVCSSPS